MMIRCKVLLSLLVLVAGPWASSATAQVSDTLTGPPQAPFFDRTDVFLAAGFVGGAVGLAFADQQLAHAFQGPSLQGSATARKAAGFFEFMGQPGPEIIGVALYGVGRFIIDDSDVAALGLHGLGAILLGAGATGIIKVVTGRARPYVGADTVPSNFRFGRGFRDRSYQHRICVRGFHHR
jgi:hypothetical protein